MNEPLKLAQKLYDFDLYMYDVLKLYPACEKFTLRTRTENCILDIEDSVERANKSATKKSHVYEADIQLSRLRRLIRKAYDKHFIGKQKYFVICKSLAEIGNLLGGWIKWVREQDEIKKPSRK